MAVDITNTLENGLYSDNDPSLQPKGTYLKGQNGTLTSKGNNYYSFESLDGTIFNFSLPLHIVDGPKFIPIGWFRLGNRLIIHSTDDSSNKGGAGEIGIVLFDNKGFGIYEAMYYHEDLKYTKQKMISGYALEENDKYHRSYWTDNLNQPRTINTKNNVLLLTFTGTADLVVGDTYMVLTDSIGYITYDGVDYGPKQIAGNIFIATSGGGTSFTPNGINKVIGYLDVAILDYTPAKAIGTIDFVQYGMDGSIFCGSKIYVYQLSTNDGYETSWSYMLNPIHVGPDSPLAGFQNYQGEGGSINSGKSVTLVINDIPTIFQKIRVAVFELNDNMDVVTNSEIFFIGDVTGTTMNVTHYGQENLLPVDIADVQIIKSIIMRAKDIATTKQRQILLNLTEREELDWEPTGVTITESPYEIAADIKGITANNLEFVTNVNSSAGMVPIPFVVTIYAGRHYVVRGTAGDSILYNSNTYYPGDSFVGVYGAWFFSITTGTPVVKGCIMIKNYDKFAGGSSYKVIDLLDEFWDYRSMASHCYLKGYWREETYRFGIVAWDKFGNPYAVRWIGDKTIKSQSHSSGDYKLLKEYPGYATLGGEDFYNLIAMGLSFDNIDITDIADKIAGISIVRVERDKTVFAQALLLQCVHREQGTVSVPISTCQPVYDWWVQEATDENTVNNTWNILGPETDFDLSQFPLPLISGDELKPVADYSPLADSLGNPIARVGIDQDVYSKYYIHNSFNFDGGTDGLGGYYPKIVLVKTVNTNASFTYNSGSYPWTFKNYDICTSDSLPDPIGSTGSYPTLQWKGATGGKRTFVLTDTLDFYNADNSGIGTGYDNADINTPRKLLVNYRRPKATISLYGGSSDQAKANNIYQFTGHYLKIDATVLADIDDGNGNYILNGVQVFGGDCFVNLYDRVSSQWNTDYNYNGTPPSEELNNGTYSWGLIFPCESNINVGLRQERHMCRDGLYNNTNGVLYIDSATSRVSQDEKYIYNQSYSTENNLINYLPLPVGFQYTDKFPYMVRYSELKFLGEEIDNMRIFLINNFRNVDALHGEINNGRVGSQDRLFYWQDKGFGYLPINEREMVTGATGGAIQLGVGGVIDRFDTIDTYFGNQHQYGVITTNEGWVWFDFRRRAFLYAGVDGSTINVGVVRGLESFFNNAFVKAEDNSYGNIFFFDQPLMGAGIVGVYDNKETIFMTFKFSVNNARPVEDYVETTDFTVIYNTKEKKFIGTTDLNPGIVIEHNGKVYSSKESRSEIIASMEYYVGMTVSLNGSTYVCIEDFITTDPILANMRPDYAGSIYWKLTSDENQIWLHNSGDICKFYGIVYPYELQVSVNEFPDTEKAFDVVEMYGNDTPITDVEYETSKLTASDLNISSKNKNFEYIDNSWWFNVALKNGKERLLDHYMLMKVKVKNYLTDPTISLNKKKRIVYLKTIFRPKS
jgi:hypothetical protein